MKWISILLLGGLAWGGGSLAQGAPAPTLSVQVRSSPVRDTPSFMGQVLATAVYGDAVERLQTKGAWIQVRASGKEGWMHQSALTSKRIVMEAGAKDATVTASSKELALAGKGFNKQVEADFKEKNKDIDFTWVNRMEEFKVSDTEARDFLKAGRVVPEGGNPL
jgi:SH3-like domain-containing protein